MIFQRAVRREFAQATAAVFTVLFAIMVTTLLIRLLNEAAEGNVDPDAVVALLGFASLNYIPTLLSLSLFVAILVALSRSYRDSEMVVWFASGMSLTAWIKPVLWFALPLVATIAMLSLMLSPWALSQSAEYRGKLSTRRDAGQVTPGTFQESSGGDRVIFVDAIADDATYLRNVFVSEVRADRLTVTLASSGHQEFAENGDRFIVLQNGRRYELEAGTAELRITEYGRYAVRVETREARGIEPTPRTMPTQQLLLIPLPIYRAELLLRLSMPIAAVVLALLAIPLSFVNPRAGRSANLLLALMVYLVYSNLMTISHGWVASGRVSFGVAMATLHLGMASLLPLLFYQRIAVYSFLRLSR